MRVTILTVGTRGDVQPYLALAVALRSRGHRVRLATSDNFASWIREWDIEFFPLRANFQTLIESPEGRQALSRPLSSRAFIRHTVTPLFTDLLDDTWAAVQDTDALIYHPKVLSGASLAERLNLPAALAATVPVITPTGNFALPGLFNRDLGPQLNRATYALTAAAAAPFQGVLRSWRARIGLSPRAPWGAGRVAGTRRLPVLYAYSPHVVPPPADWDADNHVLGYWTLPARPFTPDPQLARFLAAGAPPVYVGFGSVAGQDPARTTQTVLEAVQLAGVRAVVATGWGGLTAGTPPAGVHVVSALPHDWAFPRLAAVAHHGGAGTTAAGLSAGVPTVICPFGADQPFWGQVIHQLGAGPRPIPQKRLTAPALAAALRQAVHDPGMRGRAQALSRQLSAENGAHAAAQWVEANLGGHR